MKHFFTIILCCVVFSIPTLLYAQENENELFLFRSVKILVEKTQKILNKDTTYTWNIRIPENQYNNEYTINQLLFLGTMLREILKQKNIKQHVLIGMNQESSSLIEKFNKKSTKKHILQRKIITFNYEHHMGTNVLISSGFMYRDKEFLISINRYTRNASFVVRKATNKDPSPISLEVLQVRAREFR